MKRTYMEPEMQLIELSVKEDILATSDEEVFVDGGSLFD